MLLFVAAGAISSLVGELIGFVIFSGSQNLLISSMDTILPRIFCVNFRVQERSGIQDVGHFVAQIVNNATRR